MVKGEKIKFSTPRTKNEVNIEKAGKTRQKVFTGIVLSRINGFYLVQVIKNGQKLWKECIFPSEIIGYKDDEYETTNACTS